MQGSGGATVFDDLPESVVVGEILIRLPPKDLLRCRAVRKCWRSATSTDKFMLDHHRRQPLLPILRQDFVHALVEEDARLFISRNAGAGQQKLCPVLILSSRYCTFHAALDGLLIVSEGPEYFICNPVTRKCAPLRMPQIHGEDFNHRLAGFFRHQPSGEYRVLWVACPIFCDREDTTSYYLVAVGRSDNPRCVRQACVPLRTASTPTLDSVLRIGLPGSSNDPPVLHRGSLHWKLGRACIMVFNTTAETFRLMSNPAQLRTRELLLEIDGALAFCSISSNVETIDVWLMRDYDAEIWSFKHRINLSVVDPPTRLDSEMTMFPKMAVLNGDELLIQLFPPRRVLHYNIDGKFLGCVKSQENQKIYLRITRQYLQESVVPLPLFHETREEDETPFFVGL